MERSGPGRRSAAAASAPSGRPARPSRLDPAGARSRAASRRYERLEVLAQRRRLARRARSGHDERLVRRRVGPDAVGVAGHRLAVVDVAQHVGSCCQPMSAGASTAPARPSASSAARNARSTPASSPSQNHVSSTPTRRPARPRRLERPRRRGRAARRTRARSRRRCAPSGRSGRARACSAWMPRIVDQRRTSASGRRCRTPTPASRTEPPVSVPGARSTSPAASATAEPDEEPPGMRDSVVRVAHGRPARRLAHHPPRQLVHRQLADDRRARLAVRAHAGASTVGVLVQERHARVALHASHREAVLEPDRARRK